MNQNLIIVSNRLPIKVKQLPSGDFEIQETSGGLVRALNGLNNGNFKFIWMGQLECYFDEQTQQNLQNQIYNQFGFVALFLPKQLYDSYYLGFCNSVLWPLMHKFQNMTEYNPDDWVSYTTVNELFAEKIKDLLKEDYENANIWIQDYQLMLVPQFLRMKQVNNTLGYFHHINFPENKYFQQIPNNEEIAYSLSQCNIIGFHTKNYVKNFKNYCRNANIQLANTKVKNMPLGVCEQLFSQNVISDQTQVELSKLQLQFQNKFVYLGVDRVDYIKGLEYKFAAFDLFLQNNKQYQKDAILVQIAVPSREDNKFYSLYLRNLQQQVKEINEKYQQYGDKIVFLYQSFNINQLIGFYKRADACVISSVSDGMNLVAYEYVLSQEEQSNRVLLLSKFAGCAKYLKSPFVFNPFNIQEFAGMYKKAIELEEEKKQIIQTQLSKITKNINSENWMKKFAFYANQINRKTI